MKRVAQNLLLLLFSLAFAALILEGAIRLWEARSPALGARGQVPLDRLNYNHPPVSRAAPPGRERYLSFGDSFAFAIVHPRYSYHKVAERLLADTPARPEIVNLGEPAISFPQYMAAYRAWSRVLEHRGAVFNLYLGNDLLDLSLGFVAADADPHHALAELDANIGSGRGAAAAGALEEIVTRVNFVPRRSPSRLYDHLRALVLGTRQRIARRNAALDPEVYTAAAVHLDDAELEAIAGNVLRNFQPGFLEANAEGYAWAARFARFTRELARERPVYVLLSPPQLAVDPAQRDELARRLGLAELDPALPFVLLEALMARLAPEVRVLSLDHVLRCAVAAGVEAYVARDTHWTAEGNAVVGAALARLLLRDAAGHVEVTAGTRCPLAGSRRAPTPGEAAFLDALLASVDAAPPPEH